MLTFEASVSGGQVAAKLTQDPEEFYYFLCELRADGPDVIIPLLREAMEYGSEDDLFDVARLLLVMSEALFPTETDE